jgi:Fe-S cluster assembly protein SufD
MKKVIVIQKNQELILPILWTGEEPQLSYDIRLAGNGAKITLLALLLGKDMSKLNLKINIYHQKPDTKSRIIVKGALTDTAYINFDGLVKIEPGAKGSNAWLAAHILLLSDKTKGRAVPSLEILENDIKAGHTTTIGHVNDDELFYLMSRGLTEKNSKSLIVNGFLSSILNEFPQDVADQAKKELASFTSEE